MLLVNYIEEEIDKMSFDYYDFKLSYQYVSALDELNDVNSTIRKAHPSEPVFVLRGRDIVAAQTIRWWCWCAKNRGVPQHKLERAHTQIKACEDWFEKSVPTLKKDANQVVFTAEQELESPHSVLNSAQKHEPVFVLVASDVVAVEVIEYWAFLADSQGVVSDKVVYAMEVAQIMLSWRQKNQIKPRIPGVSPRSAMQVINIERGIVADSARPVPDTDYIIHCLSCNSKSIVGRPPYTEKVLTDIRGKLDEPCIYCGAQEWYSKRDKKTYKTLQLRHVSRSDEENKIA